ncbi:MAG TPA: hypothetical protein DCZ13_05515 [Porticoccaceae bacterium]|nr:hypothetical protein [Porticoccaceae bacterium]
MSIIAVASPIADQGQTTTAVSLAGALVQQGLSVILADLDPRNKLADYFGEKASPGLTFFDLFSSGTPNTDSAETVPAASGVDGIALIPAGTDLATSVQAIGAQEGKGLIVSRFLSSLEAASDPIVINCPQDLGILMVNALAASDTLVIPIGADALQDESLGALLQFAQMVENSKQRQLKKLLVLTRYQGTPEEAESVLAEMKDTHGELVWPGFVPADDNIATAGEKGLPVVEVDPQTPAAIAFRQIIGEIA